METAKGLFAGLNVGSIVDPSGREKDIALIDEAGSWTYGEIEQGSAAVALALTGRGVGAGARVAILSDNRAEFIPAFFGAMRAGCITVPISTRQSKDKMRSVVERVEPAIVLGEIEFRDASGHGSNFVSFQEDWRTFLVKGTQRAVAPGDDDVAMVLFTSGSTGRPRGVCLTHRGQIWFLNTLLKATGWLREIVLVAAPLFHGNGLIRIMCTFATGGTVILQKRFDPRAYISAIEQYRVTLITGVPTMFAMLLEHRDLLARTDLSTVQRIMMGSAAVSNDLVRQISAVFPNAQIGIAYGLTEAGGTICSTLYRPDGRTAGDGSVGFMLPGIESRLDEGVLQVRSPALAAGYYDEPEQNAIRFRDGWVNSGDVMRCDEHGCWYFVGRADDMFVCGGENVYPAEVEALIQSHAEVQQVVVVAVPHRMKGEVPVAFVVRQSDSTVDETEIKAHALQQGPAYLHPRKVLFLQSMPLAGTTKIDRAQLTAKAREIDLG